MSVCAHSNELFSGDDELKYGEALNAALRLKSQNFITLNNRPPEPLDDAGQSARQPHTSDGNTHTSANVSVFFQTKTMTCPQLLLPVQAAKRSPAGLAVVVVVVVRGSPVRCLRR